MKLKENIKLKVDQLEGSELRKLDSLIESLKKKRSLKKENDGSGNTAFLTVIELMAPKFLTSDDILLGRQEEI